MSSNNTPPEQRKSIYHQQPQTDHQKNTMSLNATILTYHSQNISGSSSHDNDHVALVQDLEAMHDAGIRIISLDQLLDKLDRIHVDEDSRPLVCLTFDDGCDFDVRDIDYPGHGVQRSFVGILQDFIKRHGKQAQADLHATSFVIASDVARRIIDQRSLFGHGWISDDWWREYSESNLISIANHGWDHNHPDLANEHDGESRGGFHSVDTREQCEKQVLHAAEFIHNKTGAWPGFFAYPFGESSEYIRQQFFPQNQEKHRCRAALGTEAGKVNPESDRWNLPRYVCGRDWHTPEQLLLLVST